MPGRMVKVTASATRGVPAPRSKRRRRTGEPASGEEHAAVVERPDGCYWVTADSGREMGPFATRAEALAATRGWDESVLEPGETLDEAMAELGIADWIDPDTGEPAEEEGTRIEEH